MSETYPQSVLGYRSWRYSQGRLCARVMRHTWEPQRTHKTVCRTHGHLTPDPECECGLYAYHQLKTVVSSVGGALLTREIEEPMIIGAVIGKGEARVYHLGWRASEVQIIGIWASRADMSPEELQTLAERYHTKAYSDLSELAAAAEGLAAPAPPSLFPEPPLALVLPGVSPGSRLQRTADKAASEIGFGGAAFILNTLMAGLLIAALVVGETPLNIALIIALCAAWICLLTAIGVVVDFLRLVFLGAPHPNIWERGMGVVNRLAHKRRFQ